MNLFVALALVPAVLAAVVTLVLSLVLPTVVRPWLVKLGIMDVPNERSSHERPVLRGLGLAVLIAMLVGGLIGVWSFASGGLSLQWSMLLTVAVGATLAGLLGLAEDLRGLSVKVRSICLLLLGLVVPIVLVVLANRPTQDFGFVAGEAPTEASALLSGQGIDAWIFTPGASAVFTPYEPAHLPLWLGLVLVPYALLFISSYINVANFMDGLNGISGFHGVIAGSTFAAAGWLAGIPWLLVAGLVLAMGFLGFLPWNLTKPGAFLGDVGSYLLGGAVAITSFAALVSGVPILATIGPMIIYFGDVGVTLVKRVRAGHKWDEPHKEHVYQRLQQSGLSHVAASGVNALFTLVAALLGLASFFLEPIWWIALTVAGLALVVLYNLLPRFFGASATR